ncbi:PH domain-containing protein [Allosaccharopolyspora coralli]|uniref:PH domain-containing protein n=1 Tax=Allosaccharopolyspora coralli TaxID=2665642 RepID=UPI001E39683D|nr:PH domain-containing protein [Allosaccharopolyspora coralli]
MTAEIDTPRRWSTPLGLIVTGFVLTAAAAVWWWITTTATDAVFVGLLTVCLAAVSAYLVHARPRLAADSDGVAVRGLTGEQQWPWSDVDVRVRRTERLGRSVELLEIDVPEEDQPGGLIILGRFDLGEEPRDVVVELKRIRAAAV